MKHGNTPIGYFALSGYGVFLGMAMGKLTKGWSYVKLGGELAEKYDSLAFRGRARFGVYGTYSHLIHHSNRNVQPLKDAFVYSKEAGDYNIAAYSSVVLVENLVGVGKSLTEIRKIVTGFFDFLERTSNYDYLTGQKANITCLNVLENGFESNLDEIGKTEEQVNRVSFYHIRYVWEVNYLLCHAVYGKYDIVEKTLNSLEQNKYRSLSTTELTRSMVMSMVYTDLALQSGKKQKALKFLKKELKVNDKLAKLNHYNYAQVAELQKGCIAHLKGDTDLAVKQFEMAIKSADAHDFIHFKALIAERLAVLYSNQANASLAAQMYTTAQDSYKLWGATKKVQALNTKIKQEVVY